MRLAIAKAALHESLKRRRPPEQVQRILIAHHLLLGDTLMLTPLLAALRSRHPDAHITMAGPKAFVPLYATRPYAVLAIGWDPRDRASLRALQDQGPYDLAIIPAETRHGWLARAAGAAWVRAFAGDKWRYRAAIDEEVPIPATPSTLSDMTVRLTLSPFAGRYQKSDWPAPPSEPFAQPTAPYVVLHLGAGSPLKYWPAAHWRTVALELAQQGFTIVLSTGAGQEHLARDVDPAGRYRWYAGSLTLAQLWRLVEGARLLVLPDTGVLHLAKLTLTPTVALFGPGNATLFAPGAFFQDMAYRAVTTDIRCRDESVLFNRHIPWLKTCQRLPNACPFDAQCSRQIEPQAVMAAAQDLLAAK